MRRNKYTQKIRLLGAAMILIGVVALIYISRSHGQAVLVFGLIIVAGVVASGAGETSTKRTRANKSHHSPLKRSLSKWWHG